MKVPVAFIDANVMYSRTICDWIFMLRLELPGMIRLYSSADAIEETTTRLRRNNPTADGSLTEGKRQQLHKFLDDVVTDFDAGVPFEGTDIHDHHIHAAAIAAKAEYLVTDDVGFDRLKSDAVPYEVHSADSFFCLIAENAPHAVQVVIVKQLAYWADRDGSKTLVQALRDAGCPEFAARVEIALPALSQGRSIHTILATTSAISKGIQ